VLDRQVPAELTGLEVADERIVPKGVRAQSTVTVVPSWETVAVNVSVEEPKRPVQVPDSGLATGVGVELRMSVTASPSWHPPRRTTVVRTDASRSSDR
jgi:hypothetical protein